MRFNCLKQLKHGKRVQAWLAQGVFVRWSKSSSNVNEHSSCACHSGCSMANANQLVALCFHLTLVANLSNGALLKTTALLFISHNHFRKCLPFRHSVFLVETKNWKRLMWSPWQKWLLVGVNWFHWAFILTLVANLSDGGLLKTIAFLCISHNHFRQCLPFRHSVFLVETKKSVWCGVPGRNICWSGSPNKSTF